MDGEGFVQCPVCGSALESVMMQEGVYDCPNCGEVEEDKDGFVVNGRFFRIDPADREGFGEIDASDEDGDFENADEFVDDEDNKTLGSILAGLDLDIDDLDELDEDEIGEIADLDDIGFTLDIPPDDVEEHAPQE
ncbi:MAG: hypothetical protein GY771_00820 [bacterium]|nr:hypothetical protein [bacterium]